MLCMLSQGIQWNNMEYQRQGKTRQQEIMKNILRDSNEECKRITLNVLRKPNKYCTPITFLSNVKSR